MEWHEAFTVLLGPEGPEGAMFGPITMATITILDNEVSGSLVLPASPVVSLRVLCGEPQTVLWFATECCVVSYMMLRGHRVALWYVISCCVSL